MAQTTNIEWTDRTWNPIRGCSRVSAGCDNCYAMHFAHRFHNVPGHAFEGLTVIRNGKVDWKGNVKLVEDKLLEPLKLRKPQKIFVNSMSDLFHPSVPFEFIDKVFAVAALCPQHKLQILTKRPERMLEYMESDPDARIPDVAMQYLEGNFDWDTNFQDWHENGQTLCDFKPGRWPLSNVWLGVSVEDQETADERIPLLLQTPAAVRFVSMEPMLGEVDLAWRNLDHNFTLHLLTGEWQSDTGQKAFYRLDWVIVGGESGRGARPFDITWARSIVRQCKEADTPVFVKQLGAKAGMRVKDIGGAWAPSPDGVFGTLQKKNRKGDDMSEWPEDLRVRELPGEVAA